MTISRYQIGSSVLDCQTMNLINGTKSAKLSSKVFELLKLFLTNKDHIVARKDAIESIWLGNEGVGKNGYTNAIWTLRKSFRGLGIEDEVFLTLPKIGYQLMLPVISADTSAIKPTVEVNKVKMIAFTSILVSVAVIVLSFYLFISKNDRTIIPQKTRTQSVEENTRITNYEGVEEHPAVSHNGKYLAFQWFRNGHKGSVYLKEIGNHSSPLKLVTMRNDEEASPAWSASDSSLAYVRILENGQCQIRTRRLVTNEDILIDEGCYYQPFKRVISWSNQHDNTLLYSKKLGNGVALFSFDFDSNTIKQVTFPEGNMIDYAPHYSSDNSQIAFIRASGSQKDSLMLQNDDRSLSTLLKDKVGIIDLDWDIDNNAIFVNYSKTGRHVLERISVDNLTATLISQTGLASNISFNSIDKVLYFSSHISKEYIAQLSFEAGKVIRRISSSSRDMYGRYVVKTGDILFLSNRSNYWSLWLNDKFESVNLSKELGNASVPAVSPDSKRFVTSITSEKDLSSQLYLGSIETGQLEELSTNGLFAENISWSRDGKSLYFLTSTPDNAGIYRLTIASNKMEQVTHKGENYAIEGPDGKLYYSKNNQKGIWQLDLLTQQSSLITDELSVFDYGAFFWLQDELIYLKRGKDSDEIKSITLEGNTKLLLTYPLNSIRKFFGISSANDHSFIATLKTSNEADINAVSITAYTANPTLEK